MSSERFTPAQMQQLEDQLIQADDVRLYRRTLALLMWGRGTSVTEIATVLRVRRQSVYNWLASYTSASDPARLRDAVRSGRPPCWTSQTEALLADAIASAADQFGYLAVNWTVPLLQDHLERACSIRFSDDTIRRALHHLGYVWKRYRYVLDEDPDLEKKTPYSWSTARLATTECRACGR
jgi:transposase